jgi:hypothetical protein
MARGQNGLGYPEAPKTKICTGTVVQVPARPAPAVNHDGCGDIFFHPDCNCRYWKCSNSALCGPPSSGSVNHWALADYTADREFHPALKTFYSLAYEHDIIQWDFFQ